jgi:hypothetical protein
MPEPGNDSGCDWFISSDPHSYCVQGRLLQVASEDVRHSHVATLNHAAYELAHGMRVRATDDRVTAWLLAGETRLDSAIHAPVRVRCPAPELRQFTEPC